MSEVEVSKSSLFRPIRPSRSFLLPLPAFPAHHADVQPFLKLLDATVKASRLSGTKTKQLSQDSLKIPAAYDTKLVSSFLKLNNSLKPASQQRISSLYVFDAIARANKGQKGREGFMEKMEGVVDSWVRGMLTDGNGEAWAEGRVSFMHSVYVM
jgi:protein NRD1